VYQLKTLCLRWRAAVLLQPSQSQREAESQGKHRQDNDRRRRPQAEQHQPSGANLGLECAIFEAVHGSAPDIAGKYVANPTALLQSAVLMLRHLDEEEATDQVQKALEAVYAERKTLTRDVGGTAGTTQFADAVLAAMT
jgi:hypothetical protein